MAAIFHPPLFCSPLVPSNPILYGSFYQRRMQAHTVNIDTRLYLSLIKTNTIEIGRYHTCPSCFQIRTAYC